MLLAHAADRKAADYVIASGETNYLSDFVAEAFAAAGLDWKKHVQVSQELMRPSEISASASIPARRSAELGLARSSPHARLVRLLVQNERTGGTGLGG